LFAEDAIVRLCVLASGSSGNATLVATGRTRLLIDAGLSARDSSDGWRRQAKRRTAWTPSW